MIMTVKYYLSLIESKGGLRSFAILTVPLLIVAMTACGLKKDPVPLAEPTAPAISNLAHTLEADTATLTWSVPQGDEFRSHVAGFVVYRSKENAEKEKCEGCPILFSPVADLQVDLKSQSGPDPEVFTYSEQIEKGFRYIYKTTVLMKSGAASSDSNLVEFTY